MIKVGSLNRSIGSKSKIGCVLDLDFKHLDGDSFMSNRDCYGHLCTNHGSKWQLNGRYFDGVDDYCISEDTEVLTRDGWKGIKDVTYDDEVATLNTETDELEYQKPSRLFNFGYNGKMCRFYGRHLDVLVTPDHQVYVSKYKSANDWHEYQLEKALTILNEYVRFKKDCYWNGKEQDLFTLPAFEDYPTRILKMDSWLDFFGWWIAEGSIRENQNPKTKSTYYQIIISQSSVVNEVKCKEIERAIESLGWDWSYSGHNYYIWTGYNKQLVQYLRQFSGAENKYIPIELKNLSVRQLNILLNTLMAGDGHRNQYYSKSKRLCDDIQEICLKLGYSADVSYYNKRQYPIWTVGMEKINTKPRINEWRNNRETYGKGEEVEYNGLVFGITVPKYHIIYCRRNGKGCWIGNCDCGNAASLQITDKITLEFWMKPSGTGYRMPIDKSSYSTKEGYASYITSDNCLAFMYGDGTNWSGLRASASPVTLNSWQHWVITFDGSYVRFYKNGRFDVSMASTPATIKSDVYNLWIGRGHDTDYWFNGPIPEVRIYNRGLSAAEPGNLFSQKRHLYGI